MAQTDIIGICVSDWYGVRRALRTYTDTIVSPAEAKFIIAAKQPKVVLFGCYMPEWEPILTYAREQGCVCVLTWFASYILNEFNSLNRRWLHAALDAYARGLFTHIATPHHGLARTWSARNYPTAYLPLTVNTDMPSATPREGVHIGIFGSGQPWKNMECQLVAASMISGATIHVQQMPEQKSALTSLRIPVEQHSYVRNDAEYYQLLGSMTVNLCVSLSETYSYLTAESFLMGTPVLTSHITPIVRDLPFGHVLAVCRTSWFDDPEAIAMAIRNVIADRQEIARVAPSYMREYNAREQRQADTLRRFWHEQHPRLDCVRS